MTSGSFCATLLVYMRQNFWKELPRPFWGLAPMINVTDIAFRQIISKYSRHGQVNGGPDVFWTEFVAADGLDSKGQEKLLPMLAFDPKQEMPIVAQVFGSNPVHMKAAAKLVESLGFAGIDINMGCPDKAVVKQGAGAGLIKTPEVARAIIRAALEGAPTLPVSVKTRVGFNKEELDTWIPEILKEDIAALTIHARTKKDMSDVPANWDYVKKVVELVKASGKDIPVIGNGDIQSQTDGLAKQKQSGCAGLMVGRGIFGNPWFFDKDLKEEPSQAEKLRVLLEHTKLYEKLMGDRRNFAMMKKHYKAYVNGWAGAKELRVRLMECNTVMEVENIITEELAK